MPSIWVYSTCALVVYSVTSYIFFKFPTILHKKKTYKSKMIKDFLQRKGVLHVSHRGGSREHLENTLVAFKHAISAGTNSLEMDVHTTKDGQIVVCHDHTLDRLCGINRHISEYNYLDIPPFQSQVPLHFSNNKVFDSTKEAEKDRRMPLLREVFEAFPDIIINVELKDPTPEAMIKTNLLIKEFNREHLTFWGCRNKKDTLKILKINPNALVFFSAQRIILTYISYFLGFLPFLPIPEHSMQIPMFTKDFEEQARNARVPLRILFWIIKLFFKASGPLIKHLEKRGIVTIFWVLNHKEDWQRALEKGTHGIMTDIPTELTEYLKEQRVYVNAKN